MTHRPSARKHHLVTLACAVVAVALPLTSGAFDTGFAGMSTTDDLMAFDLATGTSLPPAIDLLPEGNYPYDVTIHPDGHELWIVGAIGDGVVVIDTTTLTVVDRIDLAGVGEYPVDILFGREGDLAYVSSRNSEQVVVIDVASHTPTGDTIPISAHGLGPGKMALNPINGLIYIVDWYDDQLHVVDPSDLSVTSQVVGNSLWEAAIDSGGTRVYLADRGTDVVHVLDAGTLAPITSIPVGDDPWGLALTPDDAYLFVANEDSSNVTVIDTDALAVETTIPLAADAAPRDVDVDASGTTAYVPSGAISGDDVIYAIDVATLAVVDTISMAPSSNPNVIAVSRQRGLAVFADGFETGDTSGWSDVEP